MAAALRRAAGSRLRTEQHVRWRARCAWGYTIAHLSRRSLASDGVCHSAARAARRRRARTRHASALHPMMRSRNGRWRAEFSAQAALEAWNYNPSHEELYGLVQGVTYGLRDGLVLMARQRLYYISQRRNDSRAAGPHARALRARVYRRGRTSGVSAVRCGRLRRGRRAAARRHAVQLPRDRRRRRDGADQSAALQAIAAIEVIHVSNAGLAGHDRNPDIEAIGPSLGFSIGF